jgi:hypothetical protein
MRMQVELCVQPVRRRGCEIHHNEWASMLALEQASLQRRTRGASRVEKLSCLTARTSQLGAAMQRDWM